MSEATTTSAAIRTACRHCGNPLGPSAIGAFCCSGCSAVHDLITHAGLSRYYELRPSTITPPAHSATALRPGRAWLELWSDRLRDSHEPLELTLKLQGLRCAACVWLIQELFAKRPGARRVLVNSGRGSLSLCVDPQFPLASFVDELERFGYLLGERVPESPDPQSLLLRTAVCLALSGNAMMFAIAIYLGLHVGPLYRLLHGLNFACATLAVMIGAPVFLSSAWLALRRGVLHLDLPIAVGIVLTYAAALWSFATDHPGAAYFDSLATFIALMLLGRWLKERVVVENQKQLLANDGIEQLLVRRVQAERVQIVPALELKAGDVILVPPGDLVPVAATLLDSAAACSLDWINGESEAAPFSAGSVVPAGAFNAEASPLYVRACTDFAASALVELLGRQAVCELPATRRAHAFSFYYVLAVLLSASAALLGWTLGSSLTRGLEVATAVCVVTCPCAIGIATPLAQDLVLAGLRRVGLFVRSPSFLDRALSVRRVVFDKTGTLTTGRLQLEPSAALDALSPTHRDVLYTLATASTHPKSAAAARAFHAQGALLVQGLCPIEIMGLGVQGIAHGHTYRLGQPSWALAQPQTDSQTTDIVFSVDGEACCVMRTHEMLRDDAVAEVAALANDGFAVWILSGDDPKRVRVLAQTLGITEERALGGFTPQGKAAWVAQHDRADLLMIGDGINDSLAVMQAFTSGTPSIDRGFMPWRSDFYFVTAGLAPVRLALKAARRLSFVLRRNQIFAVGYNISVVTIAMCGWMKPWLAALLMPASSLVVLLGTSLSLSRRSSLWRS
jgi:Cu2+-exporting ATPase